MYCKIAKLFLNQLELKYRIVGISKLMTDRRSGDLSSEL